MFRLGVVSFLNSRPLVEGLEADSNVRLVFDVPSALPGRLDAGQVDAALIPTVDILEACGRYRVVSDACIGCDGETMTVRVFSQTPPDRITTLYVDGDSHTSIALANVLWRELHNRELRLEPVDARRRNIDELESVLLIGDKVVDRHRRGFAYEIDLGGAWRHHTGLPFVFAAWACRADYADAGRLAELSSLLKSARDTGVANAEAIAEREGPKRWWPVDLAKRYLMHCLKFRISAQAVKGADRFARLCIDAGIVPAEAELPWPAELTSTSRTATTRE